MLGTSILRYGYALALLVACPAVVACGSGGKSDAAASAGNTSSAGGEPTGGTSGSGNGTSGSSSSLGGGDSGDTSGNGNVPSNGGAVDLPQGSHGLGTVVVGPINGEVSTKLPKLPTMTNVYATVLGDSLNVFFDPIDGASDYRVYVLPNDGDVSAASGGAITIKNATYRCAGNRQAPVSTVDNTESGNGWVATLVNAEVGGFGRKTADATLGYVYATPGEGRIPVYALGDPNYDADNNCFQERWGASRAKKYVTSESERATLLGKRWRDDGIVFYVPAKADSTSSQLYLDDSDPQNYFYFASAAEAAAHAKKTAVFPVLKSASADTVPLMRVYYLNYCGNSHDELVATKSRFDRAFNQGDKLPMFAVHWAGLTDKTTLVVEALDTLCPYTGQLTPQSAPALSDANYPAWSSIEDARKASATGEVYINGQGPAASKPKPLARSFIEVSPVAPPKLDWFMGFGPSDSLGTFADADCGATMGNNCFQQFRQKSELFDTDFMFPESDRHQFGKVLGELWVAYADLDGDANGKFRITPNTRSQVTADSYLYVTMEVDAFTTGRRYPQIIISDQDPPIDWNFYTGNSLVVQTFKGDGSLNWPHAYSLEICDHRTWDVNQQCPAYPEFRLQLDPKQPDPAKPLGLAPNDEVGEHVGVDVSTRFEVYASTKRAYLLLDGKPFGCVDLPAKGVPSGAVSVTFGDVLYHSDADDMPGYASFVEKSSKFESHRHFDNLGFKHGMPAPSWNEQVLPCYPASALQPAAE